MYCPYCGTFNELNNAALNLNHDITVRNNCSVCTRSFNVITIKRMLLTDLIDLCRKEITTAESEHRAIRLIPLIKRFREETDCSLLLSKRTVEVIIDNLVDEKNKK